jgi:hypothetical protein
MDYIIPQSKLSKSIYNYISELFASEDGDTTIHKLESIDEDGNPLVDSYDFINNDYYDGDKQDYLFTWTGPGYYKSITPRYITQIEMEQLSKKCPNVEILDKDTLNSLNGLFGDLWKPVFIKWVEDKTNLPVKTLFPK